MFLSPVQYNPQVKRRAPGSKRSKSEEARDVLKNVVLAHVPVVDWNFMQKAVYMAMMVRRIVLTNAGKVII